MRNLLNFLSTYNNIIIFLLLEAFSVYLLTSSNDYHTSVFLGGVRSFTAKVEKKADGVLDYLNLNEKNRLLSEENLILREELERIKSSIPTTAMSATSFIGDHYFKWELGKVINNSVNKQRNFITLDKGRKDGVIPDMAVVGPNGVVGIIVSASDNISLAMSILNLDFRMSARIRKNGYFGSLTWDGHNQRTVQFNEIPYHVEVVVGDTIETSGYSAIFPAGLLVGVVSDIDRGGGDFFRIDVDLLTDFKKLNYVYIVKNNLQNEQKELERSAINE
jgi:rod shape-determining protein MreC